MLIMARKNLKKIRIKKLLVGIDEAGRGPLAGPVAVGIMVVPKNIEHRVFNILTEGISIGKKGKYKDSKKLTEKKREEAFREIKKLTKKGVLKYAVLFGSVNEIDEKGISRSIALVIERGLKKINLNPKNTEIRLDGSLKAPKEYTNQKTIIKGDEKELVIALASIVAKVERDRLMIRLARKYPNYYLEIHKGYGTENHRNSIRKFGLSKVHRKSFCKNIF